jgi:hypothetical protein
MWKKTANGPLARQESRTKLINIIGLITYKRLCFSRNRTASACNGKVRHVEEHEGRNICRHLRNKILRRLMEAVRIIDEVI